jgi:uncharacterized protein (DUF302 family)
MVEGSSVVTFTVAEPFETALRQVRKALATQALRVPVELDVSGRIRKELGVGLGPCAVLFVDDPVLLLEAIVFNRGAAVFIPQPLAVTGKDRQTLVVFRSEEFLVQSGLPASVREPLLGLHARVVKAVEAVAEREGIIAMART